MIAFVVAPVVCAGHARAHDPTPRAVRRDGSIENTLRLRDWRKGARGALDIQARFDDGHRLTGGLTINDRLQQTSDSFAIDWEWTVRGDRLVVAMPGEGGTADRTDCRITLTRSPLAFVLSDCRSSAKAIDLSGVWTFERNN